MSIKKFTAKSPDPDFGKLKSDNALAKLAHLNRLVDDVNGAISTATETFPNGGVDPRTIGPRVYFEKKDGQVIKDVIIPGVLELTRNSSGGLYNAALETSYSSGKPTNTQWNSFWGLDSNQFPGLYGWNNLVNVDKRQWTNWSSAMAASYPPKALNAELIMRETTTGRMWLIKFLKWSIGDMGGQGGFAYERYEIFPKVEFVRPAGHPEVVDHVSPGLIIKRDNERGIYNAAIEPFYNNYDDSSPRGTRWNSSEVDGVRYGFEALGDLTTREYGSWIDAVNNPANNATQLDLIMQDLSTGLYYKIKFTDWGVGNNNGQGSFAYERTLIPMDKTIQFADRTMIDSARSMPAGTLRTFATVEEAAGEFTDVNGYVPGRGNLWINSTTGAISYTETIIFAP